MERQDRAGDNPSATVWLLPLAFVMHDGEEIFTMPGWIRQNQALLDVIAGQNAFIERVVDNLSTTTAQVAVAVGFEFALILIGTAFLFKSRSRGFALYFYSALLGVFFLHAFSHMAQAAIFGGYIPGVTTAVLVVPFTSIYVYKRLFRSNLLTRREAVWSAFGGVLLILPVLMLAHFIGRTLV